MTYGLALYDAQGNLILDNESEILKALAKVQLPLPTSGTWTNNLATGYVYTDDLVLSRFNYPKVMALIRPLTSTQRFAGPKMTHSFGPSGAELTTKFTSAVSDLNTTVELLMASVNREYEAPNGFGLWAMDALNNQTINTFDKIVFIDYVGTLLPPANLQMAYNVPISSVTLPEIPVGATRYFHIPHYPLGKWLGTSLIGSGGHHSVLAARFNNASRVLSFELSTTNSTPNGVIYPTSQEPYHYFSGYTYL